MTKGKKNRVARIIGAVLLVTVLLAATGGLLAWRFIEARIHGVLPTRVTNAAILKWRDTFRGGQGQDLSRKDFSRVSVDLMFQASFDTLTRWSKAERLPTAFDPVAVLAVGRDPGLGIRALQQAGLTGKGVAVAVIDKPIRRDHSEFAGRLNYIEIVKDSPKNVNQHFHGMACASILAGATSGIARDSTLYYLAVPDVIAGRWANYAVALEQVAQLNESLSTEERIRIVSISDGVEPAQQDEPDSVRYYEAINALEATGVAVVHCGDGFRVDFSCAGAAPGRDRDNPDSYEHWLRLGGKAEPDLLVPADYRTTASNDGADVFAYWGAGGRSWACPYLAGVLALGVQAKPDATPSELYDKIVATATHTAKGLLLVNPSAFVEELTR